MEPRQELKLTHATGAEVLKQRKIYLSKPIDNEVVIYIVRDFLVEAGFKVADEFTVAAAASELATNILRYAGKGTLDVSLIKGAGGMTGIELFAADSGPGIASLEEAMLDHLSTTKNSLGSGLPSVKRIMDEFSIETALGRGTRVLARKWKTYA
ncbi:MAG TPA: ATP-binding protein [Candidatus Limiplasma sp.]|nr:ATP-binding protein [Candidatus Limiplasma sp.]